MAAQILMEVKAQTSDPQEDEAKLLRLKQENEAMTVKLLEMEVTRVEQFSVSVNVLLLACSLATPLASLCPHRTSLTSTSTSWSRHVISASTPFGASCVRALFIYLHLRAVSKQTARAASRICVPRRTCSSRSRRSVCSGAWTRRPPKRASRPSSNSASPSVPLG